MRETGLLREMLLALVVVLIAIHVVSWDGRSLKEVRRLDVGGGGAARCAAEK